MKLLALTHLSTRYFPREIRDEAARGLREHGRPARLRHDRGPVPGAWGAAPGQDRTGRGRLVDGLALALVLTAAGAHAAWNFLAKQASGGLALTWLYGLASLALWTPAAIVDGAIEGGVSLAGVCFMAGSGLLHIGYFSSLQHA